MKDYRKLPVAFAALAALLLSKSVSAQPAESVAGLATLTHVHGLAVDQQNPSNLFIATHHGLYRAVPDGTVELISAVQDFMGFNPRPNDPGTLYASGHPAGGGNLGFIASSDGGKTWTQVSPGLEGPVDFHQMTVSLADAKTVYGAAGGMQISRDGGATWKITGPAPDSIIDMAASAKNPEIVYAATEAGLLVSLDAAQTWKPLIEGAPVTLVEVSPAGSVYAFVYGKGLVRAPEGSAAFADLSTNWGERYVLHLAVDPANPERLFAATDDNKVLASSDGGRTWTPYGK